MQAVILAAGKGTRLNPVTKKRSKAMLPILGKPMVELVIESLSACGIMDFILVVSPEDKEIVPYFELKSQLGLNIRFINQPVSNGMAQAISLAAPAISGDFIVSACDSLLTAAEINLYINSWGNYPKPEALLALMFMSRDQISKSSCVELNGNRVVKIVEKPSANNITSDLASIPLYLFTTKILDYLKDAQVSQRGEYELQDAIQIMVNNGDLVCGKLVHDRISVTYIKDLLAANMEFFRKSGADFNSSHGVSGGNTVMKTPYLIEKGAMIGTNCLIGPNVYLEGISRIGNNVQISNSVVLRGASVTDGTIIENSIVT
jgi:dTDP-glucose pyrophosphorylase